MNDDSHSRVVSTVTTERYQPKSHNSKDYKIYINEEAASKFKGEIRKVKNIRTDTIYRIFLST
jgi:hypothetical protein